MSRERLYDRYRELQSYVGWTAEDARLVASIAPRLEPHLPPLVDDFYAEIDRHASTRHVITGGQKQIDRLKRSLLRWIRELLFGPYNEAYVDGRWRVGVRHVEIGLDQVYANAALARLRTGMIQAVHDECAGEPHELSATVGALNKLLDLDMAIIDEAYQGEYVARLEQAEEGRLALMKVRSEATFRHLVETAECMIVILRPDYSIDYFSPFAERLTGFSAAQVRGCNFLAAFLLEEDRRPVRDKLARVLQGCAASGFEHQVVCRDGSLRSMSWSVRLLNDFEGSPALLQVGHDITHVKEAQDRALHAERLAVIGQMVAGLAHESRNALQRSQACLEMLALTVNDRPESLDLVARIQKAQDDLHHLYEDVRGYAAPIALNRSACNLGEVWRQAWANLGTALEGRVATLREQVGDVDLNCTADTFRLGQVFRNLLDNALAAITGPVEIEIRAQDAEIDGRKAIRIGVQDNGPGLDPRQRDKIFEPFYTTKAKGTGLGLAIARRVIDAHGGRIAVSDTAGSQGALFLITLPRGLP
jgi:two-component system, LuxR family, sensor kinase FixL